MKKLFLKSACIAATCIAGNIYSSSIYASSQANSQPEASEAFISSLLSTLRNPPSITDNTQTRTKLSDLLFEPNRFVFTGDSFSVTDIENIKKTIPSSMTISEFEKASIEVLKELKNIPLPQSIKTSFGFDFAPSTKTRLYFNGEVESNHIPLFDCILQCQQISSLEISFSSILKSEITNNIKPTSSRIWQLHINGCQSWIDSPTAPSSLMEYIHSQKFQFRTHFTQPFSNLFSYILSSTHNLLDLQLTDIEVGDLKVFENLKLLNKLTLIKCEQLRNFSSLSHLNLKNLTLSSNSMYELEGIGKLTSLINLTISGSTYLTERLDLSSLTNLETLDISVSPLQTILGIDQCEKITNLTISGSNKGIYLPPLSSLKNLKKLHLTDIINLQDLRINECKTIEDLSIFQFIGKELTIDFKSFEKLKSLKILSNLIKINGIDECKSLLSIDLSHTNLEDITFLRNVGSLTYLNLTHANVNNIDVLESLLNLKHLILSDCKNLTNEQVAQLKNKLPNCTIIAKYLLN